MLLRTSLATSRALFLALGSLLAFPVAAFAQGALTPPGAPAPTMKTLSQLEPRTPLSQAMLDASAAGYIDLNTPGSYYLTGNLTVRGDSPYGILISAPNVTLDLSGYSILFVAGLLPSVDLIRVGTVGGTIDTIANVTVRNGTLYGTHFQPAVIRGIYCERAMAGWGVNHLRLESLTILDCHDGINLNISGLEGAGGRASISNCQIINCDGAAITGQFLNLTDIHISNCSGHGFRGDASNLERVVIERCGGDGVNGSNLTLRGVVARNIGGTGIAVYGNSRGTDLVISAAARGLYGDSVTLQGVTAIGSAGNGIELSNSTLTGFQVSGNSGAGVSGNDNTLTDGNARANTSHGVVSPRSSLRNVIAYQNTGAGIYCDNSSITGCVARNNGDDGIRGVSSVIADCRAYGNDTNVGGYIGQGIFWSGGKITNSLSDTASPAIP